MGRKKLLAAVTILGVAALVKSCVEQERTDDFYAEPQGGTQGTAKKEAVKSQEREQEDTKKETTKSQEREQEDTKKETVKSQECEQEYTQETAKKDLTEPGKKRIESSQKPSKLKITGITEEALCELFETDTETFAKRLRKWADENGCTDVTEVRFSDRVEWNLTEQKYSVGCELVMEKATGITNPDEGNTAVVADYHRREKELHFYR